VVPFSDYRPGNIVIVTHARQLYFVLGQGRTIRYPVGVGRAGMAWHGARGSHGRICTPPGAPRRYLAAQSIDP
jgi:lipoprotein-anchoring transpeptidase ErfK/SrfK